MKVLDTLLNHSSNTLVFLFVFANVMVMKVYYFSPLWTLYNASVFKEMQNGSAAETHMLKCGDREHYVFMQTEQGWTLSGMFEDVWTLGCCTL